MAAPVELPPPPPEVAACDGGVEFALGSAFSSRSLCSAAAAAADDEDEEAEELEALPAVVVVWGTFQYFEGYFNCISLSRYICNINMSG